MARGGGVPLFRLLGIRVTLDPSWFFIFLLVAYSLAVGYLPQQLPETGTTIRWFLGGALALALFASVLAHEFSHALVARTRDVDVDEITLFLFGGVAKMKSEPEDPASEFWIAAAGPILSIALGTVILFGAGAIEAAVPGWIHAGLWWLGIINIALAIFNLVPGFPLDGGRILRAILWWRMDDFDDATIGAARTGQVIAGLLIATGLLATFLTGAFSWLWEVLIGWFLWSAASRSIRIARLRGAVEGVTVREVMTDRVPAIRADQDVRVGLTQASAGSETPQVAVIERDGTLVGVIDMDTLREAAEERPDAPAREIASAADPTQTIGPDEPAETLVARLSALGDQLLLVVGDGELLGTVDPRALVSTLRESGEIEEGEAPIPGA